MRTFATAASWGAPDGFLAGHRWAEAVQVAVRDGQPPRTGRRVPHKTQGFSFDSACATAQQLLLQMRPLQIKVHRERTCARPCAAPARPDKTSPSSYFGSRPSHSVRSATVPLVDGQPTGHIIGLEAVPVPQIRLFWWDPHKPSSVVLQVIKTFPRVPITFGDILKGAFALEQLLRAHLLPIEGLEHALVVHHELPLLLVAPV